MYILVLYLYSTNIPYSTGTSTLPVLYKYSTSTVYVVSKPVLYDVDYCTSTVTLLLPVVRVDTVHVLYFCTVQYVTEWSAKLIGWNFRFLIFLGYLVGFTTCTHIFRCDD